MLDQSLMQVLQMAAQVRNNPNPEQMFMRMFGNNPEVQGIMNQYRGMNEQQLQVQVDTAVTLTNASMTVVKVA